MQYQVQEIDRLGAPVAPVLEGPADQRPAAVGIEPRNRFPVAKIQDAGGDEKIVPFHGQILEAAIPEEFAEGRGKMSGSDGGSGSSGQ
jgi:hypothetical protein